MVVAVLHTYAHDDYDVEDEADSDEYNLLMMICLSVSLLIFTYCRVQDRTHP
jgi:hypothetical protein